MSVQYTATCPSCGRDVNWTSYYMPKVEKVTMLTDLFYIDCKVCDGDKED